MTEPVSDEPTVTDLLVRLADVEDRGIHADDGSYSTWRQHIQDAADLAAALKARLDPGRPPHIGVLLGNTPFFFSSLLVAAAMAGLVPVGLNPPTRRALRCGATSRPPTVSWCSPMASSIRTAPGSPPREWPSSTSVHQRGLTSSRGGTVAPRSR